MRFTLPFCSTRQVIRHALRTFTVTLALGPMLVACRQQDAPTVPIESPIVALAGNAQAGFVDVTLPLALVVRVRDRDNLPMPNVPIEWRITSGAGELLTTADDRSSTVTNDAGLAAISLRPTALGAITVTASSPTLPGVEVGFTASARRMPAAVIHIDPGFDCGDPSTFRGPDNSSSVTVPVGAVVEWVWAELTTSQFNCPSEVRSTIVPPGGLSFDRMLIAGERFQFVPEVAGTWEFVDATNGGVGRLTATAP